jgi:hypothetical protein
VGGNVNGALICIYTLKSVMYEWKGNTGDELVHVVFSVIAVYVNGHTILGSV